MAGCVILIGMPGCGKSTIGVVLAKVLGYDFIDVDLLIQKSAGRRLPEIMRQDGTDGFLKMEEEANLAIDAQRAVIATGGSAIYSHRAMGHLSELGTIIYLRVPFYKLTKRLGNLKNRGVVIGKGETLKSLYDARVPLYEKYADITIEETSTIRSTIDAIVKALADNAEHTKTGKT